jgi:DNA-binding XRE family transcriptional regulator
MYPAPFEDWIHEPLSIYESGREIPESCKILAENMRYLRAVRRWSQEALGFEAGINRTVIGAIERVEINTTLGTAEKIARAFGLSLTELLSVTSPTRFGPPCN